MEIYLVKLLDALKAIKYVGPTKIDAGICYSVEDLMVDSGKSWDDDSDICKACDWMDGVSPEWPEFSGSRSFPVPGLNGLDGLTQYVNTPNQWDKSNPYCQSRYRYLDWLIEKLEAMVRRMNYTLKSLLVALKHIRDNGPIRNDVGVCNNIYDTLSKLRITGYSYIEYTQWMREISVQWDEYSGVVHYPVKFLGASPYDGYSMSMDKWDLATLYGQARYRYLDWLISQLEALETGVVNV